MALSIAYHFQQRRRHRSAADKQERLEEARHAPAPVAPLTVVPMLMESTGQLILEVSFKQLIQRTQANGIYKQGGGMRKVMGKWIIDPSIPGRIENSRFIVTQPPRVRRESDGCVSIIYNFKSRPDRSTTGLRQKGYVKFMPDRRAKYQFGNKVQVFCSCDDFKYRWHKALADKGASHTPTGIGGEAINADPVHTNPGKSLSLCKHLVAVSAYLTARRDDYNKAIMRLAKGEHPEPTTPRRPATPAAVPNATPPTEEPDAEEQPGEEPGGLTPAPEKSAKQPTKPVVSPKKQKVAGKPASPAKKSTTEPAKVEPKSPDEQGADQSDEENLDIEKPDDEAEDDDDDLT